VNEQIKIVRSVWHAVEGATKTLQSERFVVVSAELREILLALWKPRVLRSTDTSSEGAAASRQIWTTWPSAASGAGFRNSDSPGLPAEVLPDVRKTVNDAVSGLTDVQRTAQLKLVSDWKIWRGRRESNSRPLP